MSKIKRDLSILDVAQIKKHLMLNDLKQKEIAFKFGVVPSVISKIKNGQRYSEVKIDENGELLEQEVEQILPEHFYVPSMQMVEDEPLVKVDDESTIYRVQFIENYFRKTNKQDTFDESVTYVHYEPVSKISRRFIFALYKQHSFLFNKNWKDFISQVMYSTTKTVMTFMPTDNDFDWSMVMSDLTKESSILHDNINKAIKTDIAFYANQINGSIKVERDGKVGWSHAYTESLDKQLDINGDKTTVSDYEGVQTSFWNMKEKYTGSHFLEWYEGNYKQILTSGQIKFMNIMKYYQRDDNDTYTVPYREIPEKYKPYTESSRDHNRRRIRERVESAYEQVTTVSLRKMGHTHEYEFWSGFIELAWMDDEHIEEQNRLLTTWLSQRISHSYIADMFWKMESHDVLAFREAGSELAAQSLYRIFDYAEKRMKQLEEWIKSDNKIIAFPTRRKIEEVSTDVPRYVSTPSGIHLVKSKIEDC